MTSTESSSSASVINALFLQKENIMHITIDNKLKKLIIIGDRLLIKPARPDERTASGLYLPPLEKKPFVLPIFYAILMIKAAIW
jgi:hypothetical protein